MRSSCTCQRWLGPTTPHETLKKSGRKVATQVRTPDPEAELGRCTTLGSYPGATSRGAADVSPAAPKREVSQRSVRTVRQSTSWDHTLALDWKGSDIRPSSVTGALIPSLL